ncbi:MAG: hypothetical protein HY541_00720 [Deltaproteobacteria bacterium]|nr:hypothetical protein [Deltaproteobacteria bacterium]
MKHRFILGIGFLLAVFATCTGQTSSRKSDALELEEAQYSIDNAEKMARDNIAAGNLYLLTVGEEAPHPIIDKETGLKIETIGCEAGDVRSKYIQRYNEIIRDYIASKKPSPTPATPPTPVTPPSSAKKPPDKPANHAGRTACVVCHEKGIGGAPKFPANHAGRADASCSSCHKAP